MNSTKPGLPIIKLQIRLEQDIVTARQKTRKLGEYLGFDNQDQSRLATSVSELARNIFQYAGAGTIEFFFNDLVPQTLFIKAVDQGPGIKNLQDILDGVYVSSTGMGIGILGAKKLSDFFQIESEAGKGTQVIIGKSLDRHSPLIRKEEIPAIAMKLNSREGVSTFDEIQIHNRELLATLEELNKSKRELAELNAELEETNKGVLALYAELDDKAKSLKKANDVKTKFLSNMTHEFRTPLSSIISLTRLLLDRVDGELTPEQERQVNYIRKSGESLLELVSDLLDLAKVEAGRISINPDEFEIEELLSGVRGVFRPILGEKSQIDFSVNWDHEIGVLNTDQPKLAQILRNLISNSIKFTETGFVRVEAKLAKKDCIHFTVTDSGIGIKPEHLETIFEDFSQIDSKHQKNHKGTGLGLPLSRKLSRLLGGDLWVESEIGKGSVFHVLVPRVYSGEKEGTFISGKQVTEAGQSDDDSVCSDFRVLLVDDDEPSRYILKELISSQISAQFLEAKNGNDGLEKIKRIHPDVIFLDLAMPDLDGFELLDIIKNDAELKQTPVIINTSRPLTDFDRQKLSNATAILSKDRLDHNQAISDLKSALYKAGFDYREMQ